MQVRTPIAGTGGTETTQNTCSEAGWALLWRCWGHENHAKYVLKMRIFSWVPEAPSSHRAEKVHRMRFRGVLVGLFWPGIIFWRSGWLAGWAGWAGGLGCWFLLLSKQKQKKLVFLYIF